MSKKLGGFTALMAHYFCGRGDSEMSPFLRRIDGLTRLTRKPNYLALVLTHQRHLDNLFSVPSVYTRSSSS